MRRLRKLGELHEPGARPQRPGPPAARESLELPFELTETPAPPREEVPLSVSDLLGSVSDSLRTDYGDVLVAGELTSFKRAPSGHLYFSLSDDAACLDAVMWRGPANRLTFSPRIGDEVVCRGAVDVFAKQGRMQLYVQAMRPLGAGAAQRALEELKRRLHAEGLFDEARKRPLPFLPHTIGLVTSRSGAAVHDVLITIRRRCRRCRVILSPAPVQGPDAPRELLAALRALERLGVCDVVIIGRGGGASEDLSAFNDEALVRAVAGFPVPVVSAVGHEIDFTLCDYAADRRAATPTAAAELVVPVYAELAQAVAELEARAIGALSRRVEQLYDRVGHLGGRLRDPARTVAAGRQRADELLIRMERALHARHRRATATLDGSHARLQRIGRTRTTEIGRALAGLEARLHRGAGAQLGAAQTAFAELRSKLDALSPLAVLDRGYSLVSREGRLVRDARDVSAGDDLELRFHRGRARARVTAAPPTTEEDS